MKAPEIRFYSPDSVREIPLTYAVIAARHGDGWILCRHRDRQTWEIPAGHIESGETAEEAARRELFEETGAVEFRLGPVCGYSVRDGLDIKYGMLCFADVRRLGPLPPGSEMRETAVRDGLPADCTYPVVQPVLFAKVLEWLDNGGTEGKSWKYTETRRE